jgi:hypothetical protein
MDSQVNFALSAGSAPFAAGDCFTITVSATESAAAGTNTGNGTIGAVSAGASASAGVYAITLTSATAFSVAAPGGAVIGTGSVGTPFSGPQVNFTLAAGSKAFA